MLQIEKARTAVRTVRANVFHDSGISRTHRRINVELLVIPFGSACQAEIMKSGVLIGPGYRSHIDGFEFIDKVGDCGVDLFKLEVLGVPLT